MDTTRDIPTRATVATLSAGAFTFSLLVVLGIFVGLNPIWEARDLQSWDENIWYSYAPIPLLVALLLLREGKLQWGPFAVETMKLALVKLAITYIAAHTIWAIQGPPEANVAPTTLASTTTAGDTYAPRAERPQAALPDPAETGRLTVTVRDPGGAPVEGALVHVTGDLQGLTFPPPAEPLVLRHDGARFLPAVAVAHTWQDVALHSEDDSLHTAVLADATRQHVLNYPLVARGQRELMFRRPFGLMTVRCSVHGDAEPTGHLLVVDHPFAGITDASGQVTWSGVPAGAHDVRAWDAAHAPVDLSTEVQPGGDASAEARLGQAP